MGRRTYYDRPDKDIEDFVKLAKEVQTFGGQVKTLLSFVMARGEADSGGREPWPSDCCDDLAMAE
ncbi:hypothetical protein EV129_117136 [Rhizobium azibense]|uniref:Uncharacterized protein n=1 Tax=Rhizobium azibense TaxID=1136135 RepID=A0A4R3RFV5_9HYPH|nr:hypothetical protein EV129_117136 [Rhizobium azibense]